MKKVNYIFVLVSVLIVTVLGIGISYSLWNISVSQDKVNTAMTSCFDITYSSESSAINLEKQYPISDEAGSKLTPYTFKITNNCDINAYYKINLETLNTSNIDTRFIKTSLNNTNPQVINKYNETEVSLKNGKVANNLKSGYLPVGGSISFDLRVWLDYDTTINDIKNDGTDKWVGRIVVISSPATEDEISKVCQSNGGDLIDSGECRKYYAKLNQQTKYFDFSGRTGGWNNYVLIPEKNNLHYSSEYEYMGANANIYRFSLDGTENHIFYSHGKSNMSFFQFHFQTEYWINKGDDASKSYYSNFSFDPKAYDNHFGIYFAPAKLANYFKEANNVNPDLSKGELAFGVLFYIGEKDYLKLSYQNINLIDLTLMFGDGNEPDKEWCDKYLTNYYEYNKEGTLTPIKEIGEPIKTAYYDKVDMFD